MLSKQMLSKQICRACVNRAAAERNASTVCWGSRDDDNWRNGSVWCFLIRGRNSWAPVKEAPPVECLHKFEHAVALGMTDA